MLETKIYKKTSKTISKASKGWKLQQALAEKPQVKAKKLFATNSELLNNKSFRKAQ